MLNNTQIVNTKDLAESIKFLAGLFVKPEQLVQVEVTDRDKKKLYIAPSLISRISQFKLYNPDREASSVHYINGENFEVDLETHVLAEQLGIVESK